MGMASLNAPVQASGKLVLWIWLCGDRALRTASHKSLSAVIQQSATTAAVGSVC